MTLAPGRRLGQKDVVRVAQDNVYGVPHVEMTVRHGYIYLENEVVLRVEAGRLHVQPEPRAHAVEI